MKILFITGEYPPMQGGLGDYTFQLGCALQELGLETHVFTSIQAWPALATGPMVHPIASGWGWRTRRPLHMVLQKVSPDIVHIQYQTAAYGLHPAINLSPRWMRRHCSSRCVVTFHDLRVPYLFPKAGPLREWMNRTLAQACDAMVVTNPEDAQLANRWPVNGRVHQIPIGSNIRPVVTNCFDRAAQRARWNLQSDDLLLIYFGFLNASKGGEVLVESLRILHQQGIPAHLLMLGGQVGASDPTNATYLARVQQRITESGLADFVHWSGFLPPDQISANLMAADVCVLPYMDGVSYRRGSFLAALAHGCAIVTTQPVVPLPELAAGPAVITTPVGDAAAMAQAILSLHQNEEVRSRLQECARKLASRFTWDAIARSHQTLYAQLLDR